MPGRGRQAQINERESIWEGFLNPRLEAYLFLSFKGKHLAAVAHNCENICRCSACAGAQRRRLQAVKVTLLSA